MRLTKKDLHNYQINAINTILDKRKCALFLDMGLGKTAITLTAISDLYDYLAVNKILIIAPLRVAKSVWVDEVKNWEHLRHLDIVVCVGSEKERIDALNKNAQITIINRENVQWLLKNSKWTWDMVVIDESSSFKNHKSQRFKALKKITHHLKSTVLLSGTPSPNGEMDLWSQIYLLDNGQRLGKNITIYRDLFFQKEGYKGHSYVLRNGARNKIQDSLKDICISMRSEDYLDLKEPILITEYIDLPEEVKAQYDELEKEFILLLKNGVTITSPTMSVLANKLLQLCNGAIYDTDKLWHELHDLKIKALQEIIEDNPNDNILLAYNYKHDLERLKLAFPKAVKLETKANEDAWNRGEIKLLLTHPASAGHGLNLQMGGSVAVWFGLNWSLELYQQFNKRLHRQGQKDIVRIMHIVARGCLDERVMKALSNKKLNQDNLINFLKYEN